ncbi:hypothetical protein D3C78_1386660 [compost metagenome]
MEMVQGSTLNLPPTWNTAITALKPAPTIIPDLIAEGTYSTTFFAIPVAPRAIEKIPNINWKAIKAWTRSGPTGN